MIASWLWACYFTLKLWLHFTGAIRIHYLPNLALLLLAMPLSPNRKAISPWRRYGRQLGAVILGLALFWYDSYLPPFLYSMQFAIDHFGVLTSGFMHDFLKGFLNGEMVLIGAAILAFCILAAKKGFHPTPAVFLALLIVPVQALREPGGDVGRAAAKFYESEHARRVQFPSALQSPPFDIVLVQICSLSWDDLDFIAQPQPRLLQGVNILFTNFNSATSYSVPAALRLLRAPCGQVVHTELYDPWPAECGLTAQLRAAGFHTYAALNFDRHYYGMAQDLQNMAGMDAPVPVDGLPVQMLSFDDQVIYQNGPLLQRWWQLRQSDGAPRAEIFYNTMSLHGGGHEDKPQWWKEPQIPFYVENLENLGIAIEDLQKTIAASGRSAVIVTVAEHGRALRGSVIQASGLRDIPLPRITHVPAALRFVGPLFSQVPAGLKVEAPSSYLALAQLLADLMVNPALASQPDKLQQELSRLPQTSFMSETEKWKVFQFMGRYYIFGKDKTWKSLPAEAAAPEVSLK